MSDAITAAAEAYVGDRNSYTAGLATKAFAAGARWAFEQAARIAEDFMQVDTADDYDLGRTETAAGIKVAIRALAAGGEAKG